MHFQERIVELCRPAGDEMRAFISEAVAVLLRKDSGNAEDRKGKVLNILRERSEMFLRDMAVRIEFRKELIPGLKKELIRAVREVAREKALARHDKRKMRRTGRDRRDYASARN